MMFPFKPEKIIAEELTKELVAQYANTGFWLAAIPLTIAGMTFATLAATWRANAKVDMEEKRKLEKRIQELEQQLKDQGT